MEIVFFGLLPAAVLLLIAAMLVVGQVSSFLQFTRSSRRERQGAEAATNHARAMAAVSALLSRRGRELEDASRRLRLGNEELSRLNTMKTKFLSMVVHDVRTPLSVVKGYGQMLLAKPSLGPAEKRYVENIRTAADKMSFLIQELTDLAVIEAGKLRVELAPFEAADLAADLSAGYSLVAAEKGVNFLVAAPERGTLVVGDRLRLGRSLGNLVGNALKFTPKGGTVEVRVQAAHGSLLVAVKDTGPGIHPSEKKKIFEKFYQSRFQTDSKLATAGWGLGLAIAEEISRAHGGTIGVESPGLGRGATFWMRVPTAPRRPGARRVASAAAVLALLLAGPAGVRAQSSPLDEKARFEKALEERAEGAIIGILGPNRFKVAVEADLDLTQVEKFESRDGSATARSPSASGYFWQTEAPSSAPRELLPGMPVESGGPQALSSSRPSSYERRSGFLPDFVKRLSVTLILDREVGESAVEDVKRVATEVLGIKQERGDGLTVVRASFVPIWRTLWHRPETAATILKYSLIALLSVLILAVVGVCLLQLSGAMREMAHAQNSQSSISLEGAGLGGPGLADGDDPKLAGPGDAARALPEPEVRFNIRPDQVEALADMLANEDPANVAILVARLDDDIRKPLMAALAPEHAEGVYANLGKIRIIDPEAILSLKEELERRLTGAIGGPSRLLRMLDDSPYSEKARLLRAVMARDPELAARLRRKVFLLEDLAAFGDEEWSLLFTRLTNEEWSLALGDGPQPASQALLAHAPSAARALLEQMLSSAPGSAESRSAAQEKLSAIVLELMAEGRLPSPEEARKRVSLSQESVS